MSITKLVIYVVLAALLLSALFGFILPALFSAKSDIAVLLGVALIVVLIIVASVLPAKLSK